jgi:hypothetical protein
MSKLLNRLKKTTLIGVTSTHLVGPHTYKPSIPRVAFGIAGVVMTVITVAILVILPAQMDSASRDARTFAASKAPAPAPIGRAIVTRIDVVSAREPRSSTVPVRIGEAAPQPGRPGKTTLPAVVRVSSNDQ